MNFSIARSCLAALVVSLVATAGLAQMGVGSSSVGYSPPITRVEGPQPYTLELPISVTSPKGIAPGSNVVITPVITVLNKPSGVSDATALSYVTLIPAQPVFTASGQTKEILFKAVYPEGTEVGSYGYKVQTSGWPGSPQDTGAFINIDVFPKLPVGPPTVSIAQPADNTSYVWEPLVGPLVIPIRFTAAPPANTLLTNVEVDVGAGILPISTTTNADGSINATTSINITDPGLYTVRARASNPAGTALDTADFSVTVVGPPPTVSIAQPAATSFTLPPSGPLTIPFSFTGLSNWRGITSLVATLNDQTITFTPSGLNTLTATGTGNLTITTGGTYTLVVTATDRLGTATARHSFTVLAPPPPPTVSIAQPLNGSVFTRVQGSPATLIPFSFTGVAGTGTTITSLTGTLNGGAVTASVSGLNSATATATGNLSVSGPGTYTLTATTRSAGGTASASVSFTVQQTQPPTPACGVNWLPPIALGHPVRGGSKLAIKFELDCGENECPGNGHDRSRACRDDEDRDYDWNDDGDRDFYPGQRTKSKINIDKSVVVAVTELFANGSTGTPKLYRYGQYDIQGNDMYHLNFRPGTGVRRYRVEVYSTATGSVVLYGTREFVTR
jgi:hypothetical protein